MVGSGEQDYNYASLIVITAVTKKHRIDLKIRKNSELVVGSREQDYNYNIYYKERRKFNYVIADLREIYPYSTYTLFSTVIT